MALLFAFTTHSAARWFIASRDLVQLERPHQTMVRMSNRTRTTPARSFPRVVLLEPSVTSDGSKKDAAGDARPREFELPEIIREEGIPGHYRNEEKTQCKFVHEWHRSQHPTCNSVHEVDFFLGLQKTRTTETRTPKAKHLNAGGTRDAWKFTITEFDERSSRNTDLTMAFRTLRLLKEYLFTRVDHQRVDAIVNEHVSASPHIIGIYGFCGTATLNEFANHGTLYNYIEAFNVTYPQRLHLARDIATGLADIHEIDGHPASVVQHDMKLANVLVSNGKAKITDFNNCHFLERRDDGSQCFFNFGDLCERILKRMDVKVSLLPRRRLPRFDQRLQI